MQSERPWNPETVIRLLLGIFLCLCLGSVAMTGFHYSGPAGAQRLLFFVTMAGAVPLLAISIVLISRPWQVEHLPNRLLLLLGCLTVGLFLAGWSQKLAGPNSEPSSGEQMLAANAAILCFIAVFLHGQHARWSETFGLAKRRWQAILLGIIVACIFLPVGDRLQWLSAQVMNHLHLEPQEQEAVHAIRSANEWQNRLVLGVLAIGLAPVVEEILFRGLLYSGIRQAGFPRLALWLSSLLFACVHFNLVTFVPLLVLALTLTILYEKTGNLIAPITAHALFNAFNFVKLYLFERQLGQ